MGVGGGNNVAVTIGEETVVYNYPVDVPASIEDIADETEVELEANAAIGFAFQTWLGDVPAGQETTNPLTVTMDQARSITARFEYLL